MQLNLTEGNITRKLLLFSFPLMLGNLLQQLYNVVDTLIVGRYLGETALAAVGSSYTLMVFISSIILGLCMGSSAFFSIQHGAQNTDRLKNGMYIAFLLIGAVAIALNVLTYCGVGFLMRFMNVPVGVQPLMREYLLWIFSGIMATFLYNYHANLLRALGNSLTPLIFLGCSAVLNIGLDLLFIRAFRWGVAGAAIATVVSQYISGIGLTLYTHRQYPALRLRQEHRHWSRDIFREITGLSTLTCLQQSIMNFGILMVQGLVNSFGEVVMAAFAAAVKIDSFAYAPVQDFGNAFSTFVAQNHGAGKDDRIRRGLRQAVLTAFIFCSCITLIVVAFAEPLMTLFIDAASLETIAVGVGYLRIEASFYFGIGLLFLFYGYYRAIKYPGISVVLTVISLGSRVLLAYTLSTIPALGVSGIWMSIPIGWALADLAGTGYLFYLRRKHSC